MAFKGHESGKDSPCYSRQTLLTWMEDFCFESNVKKPETGQRGHTRSYCLRQNVTSLVYVIKAEFGEVTGRCKKCR